MIWQLIDRSSFLFSWWHCSRLSSGFHLWDDSDWCILVDYMLGNGYLLVIGWQHYICRRLVNSALNWLVKLGLRRRYWSRDSNSRLLSSICISIAVLRTNLFLRLFYRLHDGNQISVEGSFFVNIEDGNIVSLDRALVLKVVKGHRGWLPICIVLFVPDSWTLWLLYLLNLQLRLANLI